MQPVEIKYRPLQRKVSAQSLQWPNNFLLRSEIRAFYLFQSLMTFVAISPAEMILSPLQGYFTQVSQVVSELT